ncbi:MFS transporter [Ruegeria sp. HKCCD7559]|uniref:MFS transporter n=1 Tax=Ruegeria sp. HKCCD7559 TaxID=2683005 RepID=UPI0014914673|nr:MFS transporter [Ruegeria sp. HKCCD7559]NOC43897.1 MFS transporter [Ruegeria sp. HKCCD7559]
MAIRNQVLNLQSLFIAMAAVQLATAGSGTLVPLAFSEIGASQEAASFAASAYSAGFLVGCFVVARSIADIGHIRAFASGAAITIAVAILFSVSASTPFLVFLRFLTGLATAGLFSIGDTWLNETVEDKSRGRVLAVYAIIVGVVAVFSQFLVFVVPGDIREAFVYVALFYCVSIVVISTTRSSPPNNESNVPIRMRGLFKDAPAAAIGVFAMGMVSTTLLSVVPYNAAQLGVAIFDVALMVAIVYLGRVLFQFPLGWLSDKMDRRIVILIATVTATVVLLLMAVLVDVDYDHSVNSFDYNSIGFAVLSIILVLLGGSLLTLYSLLVAHALDRTVPVFVSSAAVTMLLVWTLGSITGPLIANAATTYFGDIALYWVNFAVMLCFALYLGQRIWSVEPVSRAEQTSHTDVLPTSTEMAPSEKR